MADTNIQFYTDTRIVFETSNSNGKTAIGSADATVQGLEIEYNLLTTPEAFKISPLGVNYTSGVINDTTLLPRIAQVESLLQSVEVPPDSTTLQVDKKILLTDGVSSGSIQFVGLNTQIDVSNNLILNPTGSINTNGKVLDMTNGEIHNCPLIQSLFDNDITIEGRGTGDVVLKTNGVNRLTISDTGFMTFQGTPSNMTYNNATDTLTATNFNGLVLNTTNTVNTNNIDVTTDNTSGNYRINLVKTGGTGNKSLFMDTNSPAIYNPSTGVMSFFTPPTCIQNASSTNQLVNFNNFVAQSFLPTIASTGGGTALYTTQRGRFTKLNNTCFIQIEIEVNDISSLNAGTLNIPLPVFNISSTTASFAVGSISGMAAGNITEVTTSSGTAANAITLGIRKNINSTVIIGLTVADITSSFKITVGGSYFVA